MKYYFSAQSHDISDAVKQRYKRVIEVLQQHGHNNINFHQMEDTDPNKIRALREIANKNILPFDYQTELLSTSEALICDVTEQSATVGYQALYAIDNKIPCLALFFKNEVQSSNDQPSVIFNQSHNGLLKLAVINEWDELDKVIDNFQNEFINKPFKFNFYIPLNLYNGISRESVKLGKTKSELVRELIVDFLNRKTDEE